MLVDCEELQAIAAMAEKALDQIEQMLPEGAWYAPDIDAAYAHIQTSMGSSPDVILRKLNSPGCPPDGVLLGYIEGLVDAQLVDSSIIAPLLKTRLAPSTWGHAMLLSGDIRPRRRWPEILHDLTQGRTLVFAPGLCWVWSIGVSKLPQRSIATPKTEQTVRGPDEAFNEVVAVQMSQLRREFSYPGLRFHSITLGRLQHTAVVVTYLEGLANPALIQAVVERLEHVAIDGRATGTLLSGLIRDHPRSIFPTMRATERVDTACHELLQGKVLVLIDGDPFALVAPSPLADFYRTALDYDEAWYDVSFVRLLRLAAWAVGVYLPALYIALTEVNTDLIPHSLLILTAGNHAGLPFPPIVEAILMVFVIEVLREAAIRLPKVLSTTIGTVGAIIVGTVVVKAGIVSPQMIFVITLTALSFYTVPVYELTGTWRVVNILMLIAAAIMGIYGLVLVTVWMIGSLISLQSFGVPYFEPLAPFRLRDWFDFLIRLPWTLMRRRLSDARPTPPTIIGPSMEEPPVHLGRGRR